jgi:hypothetical protein
MSNPTTPFGWQMPTATDLVTDLPADFEVFGQAVATDLQYLLGGTTGQVLAKASGTDLDFVWSADAAGMTNPMTTTSDMIYSSSGSTPDRIGIGSNGDVLTVTAGVPGWVAPTGTNYSYSLINAGGTALTGASTITVSGISGKNFLAICVDAASSVNSSSTIQLRFNADSSSKYGQAGNYMRNTDQIRGYFSPIDGNGSFEMGQMSNMADSGVSSNMTFTGTAGTGAKMGTILTYVAAAGGSNFIAPMTNGIYTGSSAITSVSLISSSGNFDAGTLYVYGA